LQNVFVVSALFFVACMPKLYDCVMGPSEIA